MAEMDSVIMNSPWNGDQERFRLPSLISVLSQSPMDHESWSLFFANKRVQLGSAMRTFEIVDPNPSSRMVFENLKLKKRRSSDHNSPSWMSKQ